MNKENIKELFNYAIVGVLTTAVNFVIYWLLIVQLGQGWLLANVVAWVGAVIFAFFMNRNYVFRSQQDSKKEAAQFFLLRLVTLGVESVLLFVFIDLLGTSSLIAKVIVSVVTVVSNYGLCKFKIFNNQNGGITNEKN